MRELLARLLDSLSAKPVPPPLQQREHDLRLATAALLFEVVRADGNVEAAERAVLRTAVQSAFGLPEAELDELLSGAEQASRGAASLYELTRTVDVAWDAEQKKRVIELLWLVAFADGRKDAHEEQRVRQIAGLLHVPHPDFIDARLRAQAPGRT